MDGLNYLSRKSALPEVPSMLYGLALNKTITFFFDTRLIFHNFTIPVDSIAFLCSVIVIHICEYFEILY